MHAIHVLAATALQYRTDKTTRHVPASNSRSIPAHPREYADQYRSTYTTNHDSRDFPATQTSLDIPCWCCRSARRGTNFHEGKQTPLAAAVSWISASWCGVEGSPVEDSLHACYVSINILWFALAMVSHALPRQKTVGQAQFLDEYTHLCICTYMCIERCIFFITLKIKVCHVHAHKHIIYLFSYNLTDVYIHTLQAYHK